MGMRPPCGHVSPGRRRLTGGRGLGKDRALSWASVEACARARITPGRSAPPYEVSPGLLLHAAVVNTYALQTEAGLLLVDPGFTHNSQSVYTAVRAWSMAALHTVVYTHGHLDHAFGLGAFLDAGELPHIIAQEN
jgi:glyoxylase-like metal-dependent hydrolase (beta-lactamase superfamily II)